MKQKLLVEKQTSSSGKTDTSLYDLFLSDKDISIHYSPLDDKWAQPGKAALKLHNNGNGFEISLSGAVGEPMKEIFLDYSQAYLLLEALKVERALYNKKGSFVTKSEIMNRTEYLLHKTPIKTYPESPQKTDKNFKWNEVEYSTKELWDAASSEAIIKDSNSSIKERLLSPSSKTYETLADIARGLGLIVQYLEEK